MDKRLGAVFFGVLALMVACSDGDDDPSGAAGAAGSSGTAGSGGATAGAAGAAGSSGMLGGDQVYPEAVGPALAELKQGWNTMTPGGSTTCSKGDPFAYFVRPGDPGKIVIEFSGGGACWSDSTCTLADAIFTPTADPPPYVADEAKAVGINNHTRDDNPVKDWTHVFISYCTGDIHTGNNEKDYSDGKGGTQKIRHKGAENTRAVLAWVFKNFAAPEKVLVTGCSAGGYGATFWAPHIKRHYDAAKIYHFSDSAVGIVSPSFFSEINESWKPQQIYPGFIPGADPSVTAKLSSFYNAVSNFYPDMPMSQFNSLKDSTQGLYYNYVTGKPQSEWSSLMLGEMSAIRGGAKKFGGFIAAGTKHCVLPDDDFYKVEVDGKNVASWLGAMIGDQAPENLDCADCK